MKIGVCSVTLREKNQEEVVRLAKEAGVDAIEWGGDVHLPSGDPQMASDIRKMTLDAGLEVSSYGSYWKGIDSEGKPEPFSPVLETAMALGTDTIRIWAGTMPSDAVSTAQREVIISSLRKALESAGKQDVKLALEFHANTLSDSNSSMLDLLEELGHPNLFAYWQPIYWLNDPVYRLDGLKHLASRILNMHVFHWRFSPGAGSWGESTDRRPLGEGTEEWLRFLEVPLNPEEDHYALLEFVRNDDPGQFVQDAAILRGWLDGGSNV